MTRLPYAVPSQMTERPVSRRVPDTTSKSGWDERTHRRVVTRVVQAQVAQARKRSEPHSGSMRRIRQAQPVPVAERAGGCGTRLRDVNVGPDPTGGDGGGIGRATRCASRQAGRTRRGVGGQNGEERRPEAFEASHMPQEVIPIAAGRPAPRNPVPTERRKETRGQARDIPTPRTQPHRTIDGPPEARGRLSGSHRRRLRIPRADPGAIPTRMTSSSQHPTTSRHIRTT